MFFHFFKKLFCRTGYYEFENNEYMPLMYVDRITIKEGKKTWHEAMFGI